MMHAASRISISFDATLETAGPLIAVARFSGGPWLRRRQLVHFVIQRHVAEAVHPQRPLIPDESTFDARQKPKTHNDEHRKPDRQLYPGRRRIELLEKQNTADH